jgi:glycosyltransferase involved in cell wall biosynthesis
MKVLQLTTHMNIGGIPNYIFTLSKAMKAAGVDTIVASSGGDMVEDLERAHIRHARILIDTKFEFSPKVFMSIFTVNRIIKAEGIDIIHAHTRVSQVVAFFASRMAGVPYVTTCHGYFKTRARKIFDTWGAKVIAISKPVKEHLIKDLGVNEARIALVYSGVDSSRFIKSYSEVEKDAIKKEYGLKDGPVVGHIGRLSSIKGQKYLVEAMKDVIAKKPNAQLLIIGKGPEGSILRDLAKSLGISPSVYFVDSHLDTSKLLSVMDVFCFPSQKEGLGIALLEAMAAGKACIASRIGGISDIVKDCFNGILVDVGDVKAIALSIMKLLDDEGLRLRFGETGSKTVAEKFSLETWARGVKEVYEDVLKK